MIPAMYAMTVLIWGTTWYAIKMQLGTVDPSASVAYRFAIAAVALFAVLLASGRLQRIPLRHHGGLVAQGLCLFCFNFIAFYAASAHITSGILAVVFSGATVFNAVNGYIFNRVVPSLKTVIGSLIGVAGLLTLFGRTLTDGAGETLLTGLLLSVVGTYFFSLGNIVSARNQAKGIAVASSNAWGMLYGAITLTVIALVRGVHFGFTTDPYYVWSLLYLAIPGSVVAFTAYLTVVGRIGPAKAAYMTVLFPVVALTVSTVLEDYRWTPLAFAGVGLIIVGNLVIFGRPVRRRATRTT